MGYNPHKPQRKEKPFSIELFTDVYKSYEDEFGKEHMAKHVGMAVIYLDGKGQGEMKISGTLPVMESLVSLLVIHLANAQKENAYSQTKGKVNLSTQDSAKMILANVWKNICNLYPTGTKLNTNKKPPGIAKSS